MRRRFSVFLAVMALVWAAALAAFAFVWAVDPYELRSVNVSERLALQPYPKDVTPRLAPAAAAEGVDVAIVGGSTARGFTPAMMLRAFPGATRPVNLAYPCPTGSDLGLILRRLETSRRLKELIVSLDYTIMWPCRRSLVLDRRFFGPSWNDPAPEFNTESLKLSAAVLSTGVLDLRAWRLRQPDRIEYELLPTLSARPAALARIAREVARNRPGVTAGAPLPCTAIPALARDMLPPLRRLGARGVRIDLVAPPYALAFYSKGVPGDDTVARGPLFPRLMAIRRCALAMSAGIPGARFQSFDTDLSVVGDLSAYYDPSHLGDYAAYDRLLGKIAAGDGVVAPGGWSGVETRLKSELATYAPPAP